MRETPSGTAVRVVSSEGNTFYGVVARISQTGQSGSPAAPTHWKAQILVDHRSKQLVIPLSKLNRGKDEAKTLVSTQLTNGDGEDIYRAFDLRQTQHQRTQMQIFTGNPLKAYEKYPKGKFLNYTDAQGAVAQGLIMPVGFDIEESLQAEPVVFQDPQQVKVFLTDVTQRQGSVKTLDELLTIRTQGSGLVLQTPKSSVGNRFVLDSDLMSTADSEFYSVGDRMELQVPADRIDSVLSVIMQQKQWSLAAFDWKEHARDYLGRQLPELRRIESQTLDPPMVAEPSFVVPAIAPRAPTTFRIAPAKEQSGRAERNTAQFLEQAGLASAVMADSDFYLQVENPPYIPLVIERHDAALHLIHWLEDSQGDLFIDTEMIFHLSETGHLMLQETAVQNPLMGGELRRQDRGFAQLFSRNLLQQGFPEAARRLQSQETLAQLEEMLPSQPVTESEDSKAMIPPQSAVLSLVDLAPEVASTPVEVESPIYQTAESDIALLRFGGYNSVQLDLDELQAIQLAFSHYLTIQSESELRTQLSEIIEPAVGRRNIVAAVNALMAQRQQYVDLQLPELGVMAIANSPPPDLTESSTLAIDQETNLNHAAVQLDFRADPSANSSRSVADPLQPTTLSPEKKVEVQSQTQSAGVTRPGLAASSETLSEESLALFDVDLSELTQKSFERTDA
ncbi:hypothetical protein H6F90_11065 [Trichocoleus sp. FACHB-591]|uniref:DUF6908 domain-containing protein n=1 Tax=Trichocoleus sp. FACHB-591 TaxID=2692872 RepID=UPI00168368FB|nr:hypothetical protein [Trichocoleus sp. FACHB-591]MBD2095694.1 hypothetical protein [Trichocoleus sp. FACHB-591]